MTHDEYIKRRDEIVELARRGYAYQTGSTVPAHANNMTREEAQQAIDELVLAVIGENQFAVIASSPLEKALYPNYRRMDYRNELRTDQRSIVKGGE